MATTSQRSARYLFTLSALSVGSLVVLFQRKLSPWTAHVAADPLLADAVSQSNQQSSIFRRAAIASEQTCTTFNASLTGRWVPREPAYLSLDDFTLGEERGHIELQSCESPTEESDLERTLRVANFEWRPSTCTSRAWDSELFLRECLKMPHGLLLVGDSLSGQHVSALRSMIGVGPDSLLVAPRPRHATPWERAKGSLNLFLNPAHPFYTTLLEEGTFSMLRLHKPVITRFTSYHLISNELLRDLINDAGGNSTTGRDMERYDWGSDEDWVLSVRAALEAYGEPVDDDDADRGTDEASKPTVVILSSGAHWSTPRLEGTEDLRLIETVFAGAVAYVTVRLAALPFATEHLRLFARTNPPPMDSCTDAREPLEPPDLVPPGTQYNYESFPVMDEIWRNNPLVEVLDLEPLVGTRPDGRRKPPPDCLHVCMPVARAWNEVLWNVL